MWRSIMIMIEIVVFLLQMKLIVNVAKVYMVQYQRFLTFAFFL